MAGEDFFQEIAMTRHPVGESDREVLPRRKVSGPFEKGMGFPYDKAVFMQDQSFEERTKEYYACLERMRREYRPFMENHLGYEDHTVKKQEIKNFEFRYLKPHEVFSERNGNDTDWEKVVIPDYRGPAKEKGKWRGYYRTSFGSPDFSQKERVILRFQCVDYIAVVYVNGNYVGSHEGLFAPFEFDVTDYLREENELYVECRNDIPTLGVGDVLDGDKLYAATGPGWDDSEVGWHHCPAGAGLFGRVTLERRPVLYVSDIFVRPDIDSEYSEIRIGVENYGEEIAGDLTLSVRALPKNYTGEEIGSLSAQVKAVGIGKNEYRYRIRLTGYRLWEPEHPWLYGAIVELRRGDELISARVGTFGMKKFVSDENADPKGAFYLNNHPYILRGANEMGHLQQCVMRGDFDQLVDDILIAKMCNMNYYRVTQRPVQEEIYDYFDMLGIFHQCDLPLFGFLRRNQFAQAVKQTVEMEHLIRSHVSSVMVTFINEPMCLRRTNDPNDKYSRRYELKGHRHLLRDELEAFFAAARKAIYTENPDRVIKNVEGDYDAPTKEGMPDFHCYTMWYSNHGEPIGRLLAGYLPPIKSGWMTGCGEYGAEGLDNRAVMEKYYPKEWLAKREDGSWFPDRIIGAQTHSVQGDWYQEQENLDDWIRESQIHQANATRLMTDAYRRRADIINHTAIHLLIDAWPAGWMKTLTDCDRVPKRAYFAYQDALVPVRVHLWCDRNYVYAGETVPVEAWLLNDTGENREFLIQAAVKVNGKVMEYYQKKASVKAAYSECAGVILANVPMVDEISAVRVDACILDQDGSVVNAEAYEFLAYPAPVTAEAEADALLCIGEKAFEYGKALGFACHAASDYEKGVRGAVLVSDYGEDDRAWLKKLTNAGLSAVLLLPKEAGFETEAAGIHLKVKKCPDVFFAASKEAYRKYHFNMLYNKNAGYIDFISSTSIESVEEGEVLVYSYQKSGFNGSEGRKPRLPFVKRFAKGDAAVTAISLETDGRVGVNPNLDLFLKDCLTGRTD